MTAVAFPHTPAAARIVPAHWPVLTDQHRELGYRLTDDGRVCGTPRTADDQRFQRNYVPVDAYGPHADAVWGVLDRLSWFTLADALALRKAELRLHGTAMDWDHADDHLQCRRAAAAAGGSRLADLDSVHEVGRHIRFTTAPPEAGAVYGRPGPETYTWAGAFHAAVAAAEAFVVADRGELTDSAYQWLTASWCAVFPETVPAVRPEVTRDEVPA